MVVGQAYAAGVQVGSFANPNDWTSSLSPYLTVTPKDPNNFVISVVNDNQSTDQFVYRTGYYSTTVSGVKQWVAFTFNETPIGTTDWIHGQATYTLPNSATLDTDGYVLAYVCRRYAGQAEFVCGPQGPGVATGTWTIQNYTANIQSCGGNNITCGTACVDPSTNVNNCGGCGNACTGDVIQECQSAVCVGPCEFVAGQFCNTSVVAGSSSVGVGYCRRGTCSKCASGFSYLGGSCVGNPTDPVVPCSAVGGHFCNATIIAHAVAQTGTCGAGQCLACSDGYTYQNGACVTSSCTDVCTNHGATRCSPANPKQQQTCSQQFNGCFNWSVPQDCGSKQACAVDGNAGVCQALTCVPGIGVCAAAQPVSSAPVSAGTCAASGNSCYACSPGTTYCAATNTCVTNQTDSSNCGTCGHACTGQTCANGQCVTSSCTPTKTCADYTGQCGTGFSDGCANVLTCGCAAGNACAVSTGQGTCTTSSSCNGANLQNDAKNCGTCGNLCPTGQTCAAGKCSGSSTCHGANLQTDAQNCGTCGHACATGQGCVAGQCSTSCSAMESDPNNCGKCGNKCDPSQVCTEYICTCPPGGPPILCTLGARQSCSGNSYQECLPEPGYVCGHWTTVTCASDETCVGNGDSTTCTKATVASAPCKDIAAQFCVPTGTGGLGPGPGGYGAFLGSGACSKGSTCVYCGLGYFKNAAGTACEPGCAVNAGYVPTGTPSPDGCGICDNHVNTFIGDSRIDKSYDGSVNPRLGAVAGQVVSGWTPNSLAGQACPYDSKNTCISGACRSSADVACSVSSNEFCAFLGNMMGMLRLEGHALASNDYCNYGQCMRCIPKFCAETIGTPSNPGMDCLPVDSTGVCPSTGSGTTGTGSTGTGSIGTGSTGTGSTGGSTSTCPGSIAQPCNSGTGDTPVLCGGTNYYCRSFTSLTSGFGWVPQTFCNSGGTTTNTLPYCTITYYDNGKSLQCINQDNSDGWYPRCSSTAPCNAQTGQCQSSGSSGTTGSSSLTVSVTAPPGTVTESSHFQLTATASRAATVTLYIQQQLGSTPYPPTSACTSATGSCSYALTSPTFGSSVLYYATATDSSGTVTSTQQQFYVACDGCITGSGDHICLKTGAVDTSLNVCRICTNPPVWSARPDATICALLDVPGQPSGTCQSGVCVTNNGGCKSNSQCPNQYCDIPSGATSGTCKDITCDYFERGCSKDGPYGMLRCGAKFYAAPTSPICGMTSGTVDCGTSDGNAFCRQTAGASIYSDRDTCLNTYCVHTCMSSNDCTQHADESAKETCHISSGQTTGYCS
jgi:hypothetical protein